MCLLFLVNFNLTAVILVILWSYSDSNRHQSNDEMIIPRGRLLLVASGILLLCFLYFSTKQWTPYESHEGLVDSTEDDYFRCDPKVRSLSLHGSVPKTGTTWIENIVITLFKVYCLETNACSLLYGHRSKHPAFTSERDVLVTFSAQRCQILLTITGKHKSYPPKRYIEVGHRNHTTAPPIKRPRLGDKPMFPAYDYWLDPFAKYYSIIRDPRDSLVSKYYYSQGQNPQQHTNVSDSIDWWFKAYFPINLDVTAWNTYMSYQEGYMVMQYEGLILHPLSELRRLATYFGFTSISDAMLEKVMDINSFDRMKQAEEEHKLRGGQMDGSGKYGRKARKGEIASYKELFSDAMTRDSLAIMKDSLPEYLYELWRNESNPKFLKDYHPTQAQLEAEDKLESRREHEKTSSRGIIKKPEDAWYFINLDWMQQWIDFICHRRREPPGPIDNSDVPNNMLRYYSISREYWNYFHEQYGGGPAVESIDTDQYVAPDVRCNPLVEPKPRSSSNERTKPKPQTKTTQ